MQQDKKYILTRISLVQKCNFINAWTFVFISNNFPTFLQNYLEQCIKNQIIIFNKTNEI